MPEGPEVAVVADAINQHLPQIFKSAEVIENVDTILHRYSRKNPKNWNQLQQFRFQTDENLYALRKLHYLTLILTAGTLLIASVFFAGLLGL